MILCGGRGTRIRGARRGSAQGARRGRQRADRRARDRALRRAGNARLPARRRLPRRPAGSLVREPGPSRRASRVQLHRHRRADRDRRPRRARSPTSCRAAARFHLTYADGLADIDLAGARARARRRAARWRRSPSCGPSCSSASPSSPRGRPDHGLPREAALGPLDQRRLHVRQRARRSRPSASDSVLERDVAPGAGRGGAAAAPTGTRVLALHGHLQGRRRA